MVVPDCGNLFPPASIGSYYPLYPPSEELNIDYESFYSYASLPVTPDVLVTPSELRYFVKVRRSTNTRSSTPQTQQARAKPG